MDQGDHQALEACLLDAVALLHLSRSAALHPRAALLFQGFVAHFSMYVVESHHCVTTVAPESRSAFSDLDIEFLRSSRHRAKLLDYRSIGDVSQELLAIAKQQYQAFNESHVGALGPLKRALQGDLGLSMCGGHIFWTTHATIYAFGTQDTSGENAFAFGNTFGQYIERLLALFGINENGIGGELPALGDIETQDIKYQAFFGRGPLGSGGIDAGASLALVLAAVNLARFVISPAFPSGNMTRLRLLFLTAFHAVAGITAVQDGLLAKREGSERARAVLREVLGHSDARWIRRQGHLRNLLAHYLVDCKLASSVSIAASRTDTIASVAGAAVEDVEQLVQRYLVHLSSTLEAGFALTGKNPFWYGKVT